MVELEVGIADLAEFLVATPHDSREPVAHAGGFTTYVKSGIAVALVAFSIALDLGGATGLDAIAVGRRAAPGAPGVRPEAAAATESRSLASAEISRNIRALASVARRNLVAVPSTEQNGEPDFVWL